jgi:hypothetical protein
MSWKFREILIGLSFEWSSRLILFSACFLISPGDPSSYRWSDGAEDESTPIKSTKYAAWSSTAE